MIFLDYVFQLIDEDTIVMDRELTADQLKMKTGDKFMVIVTVDGQITLMKIKNERDTGTN